MENFKGGIMRAELKKSESMSTHAFSQYELTTNIITKLNTFKLTPTAKLVLLYLTTCYNPKHKEVFPKQKTIADKLGISERSVTRAIQELFNEGLVLIECKYTNRYKFTSRIVSERLENLSETKRQNDISKRDNLSHHEIEQKKETKKEPVNEKSSYTNSIEIESFKILKDYATKHGAKNVEAYINVLRKNGSADKIIKDYKAKQNATKRALRSIKETQSLIKKYENMKKNCILPSESPAWVEFRKKINAHRKTASVSV